MAMPATLYYSADMVRVTDSVKLGIAVTVSPKLAVASVAPVPLARIVSVYELAGVAVPAVIVMTG